MKMTIVVVSLPATRKVNNEADGPCTGTKSMATAVRDRSNQFRSSSIWRVLPSMKTPFLQNYGLHSDQIIHFTIKKASLLKVSVLVVDASL